MKKILVIAPLGDAHKQVLLAAAGERATLLFREQKTVTDADVQEADVMLGLPSAEQVKKAGRLAWLQLFTAGTDPFAAADCLRPQATLTNAASAHALSVAEHAAALTFALLRGLKTYAVQQQARTWAVVDGAVRSVEGARIAVLGLGAAGGMYAAKMKALGAHVTGVRRRALEKPAYVDEVLTIEHLDEVLPSADVVTMVLPGGAATTRLMDERRLRLMKADACLINVGRGSAIDHAALKRVLADGHLRAVALDVTEPEPLPADDALWGIERVFITPHVASRFLLPGTMERAVQIAADNLARFLAGEALTNVVDRNLGY